MARPAGLALCGLLAWGASVPAGAQNVYRCGADGRSYSQQPCAEGRALAVGDARGADERREGEAAAARQSRAAEQLAQERRRRDAAPVRAASLGRNPSGDPTFAPTAATSSGKKPDAKAGKKKSGTGSRASTSPGSS